MNEIKIDPFTINKKDPDEFRLRVYNILREFVEQPDAEVRISCRNDEDYYLSSNEPFSIDIGSTYVHIKKKVKVQKKGSIGEDIKWITTTRRQLIRVDDITCVELTKNYRG